MTDRIVALRLFVRGAQLVAISPQMQSNSRKSLLSGQKLSAVEAKEYGAVNEVVSRKALLVCPTDSRSRVSRQHRSRHRMRKTPKPSESAMRGRIRRRP
jgi:enoyl-CoA hydratase/carnithine racemase